LWKRELVHLADEIGVPIHVCHFPLLRITGNSPDSITETPHP